MTAVAGGGAAEREPRWPLARLLPVVAVVTFVVVVGAVLAAAGSTLGYDLAAYTGAADRLLAGRPLYDPNVDVAGGFAIYLYPPPFALLVVPLAPLTSALGPWPWIAALTVCFLGGVALLPVRTEVRWLVLLLGGLSWPLAYSLKLGQVGPILFLVFAAGWRWLDRPAPLGATIALGTIVKVQPALLFGWALLTRRWRTAAVGIVTLAVAAVVATLVAGPGTWAGLPRAPPTGERRSDHAPQLLARGDRLPVGRPGRGGERRPVGVDPGGPGHRGLGGPAQP